MTVRARSAADAGLVSCLTCGLLARPAPAPLSACPRCNATLHERKPASLVRTWTLLVCAMALYVPANVLPIMETDALFQTQTDTIMSGVVYLWNSGSWAIAIVVFVASITVPLAKMVALLVLLLSVQFEPFMHPGRLGRLYRFLETIGRWSMLDVYVVAVLVTLVQLQTFARITPASGALAFATVVVLTMLATMSFDPRLIWDAAARRRRDG